MILTIIILSLLLVLSIALNVFLIWYNRQVIDDLLFVSDNIGDMVGLIKEYHEHLESLYEMEMFYGDSTLKGLMDHTRFILEEAKVFEEIYGLTRKEEEGEKEEREDELDDRTDADQEA